MANKNLEPYPICAWEGCEIRQRTRWSDGYCAGHHRRNIRGADMAPPLGSRIGHYSRRLPDTDTERWCRKCDSYKSFSDFHTSVDPKDAGYQNTCIDCNRWRGMSERYKLTKDQWLELFDAQGGACAVCRVPLETRHPSRKVATDHCHNSLKVRGITCFRCNAGLGFAETIGLELLANYLEKHA